MLKLPFGYEQIPTVSFVKKERVIEMSRPNIIFYFSDQ